MSTTIYNIALIIHVIGITVMAGTTFIDFVTFRAFSAAYRKDRDGALVLEIYLNRLQRFLGIGMLFILLSGITMMAKLHEVWGAQIWFRIKMGVLLLIIINGMGIRRILGSKLKRMVSEGNIPAGGIPEYTHKIKRNFTLVQVIQMVLFIIIYVLSIFKFN